MDLLSHEVQVAEKFVPSLDLLRNPLKTGNFMDYLVTGLENHKCGTYYF